MFCAIIIKEPQFNIFNKRFLVLYLSVTYFIIFLSIKTLSHVHRMLISISENALLLKLLFMVASIHEKIFK